MNKNRLGKTDIKVSCICLGTMTWGEQNTEQQAHEQMDMALDHGVNFFDAAELYPVPPREQTYGLTETYIGSWFQKRGCRDHIVLASKVAGPAQWLPHIRGGSGRLNRKHITEALEASLRRLQTDYIDLYQLHWPDRPTNYFGKLGYHHEEDAEAVAIEETLSVLQDLVDQGKIRHIGISNETPWGAMEYLRLAGEKSLPRVQSIQNPYNLLNRTFEIGLAEIAHREKLGLLAYSPLAFGVLSGKYVDGARPPGARLTLFERFDRYSNREAVAATSAYVALARENGLDPAQMALAYVSSRPFLTSNIIGATTPEQLRSNLQSAQLQLSREVLEGIEAIHVRHPNPSP